ncbi:MAG: histidine phosphatase family protein [Pirellulaceae bacterium]|nr:histidine phosphatase family protein [Pirellulaceae bacterium]
MDIKLYVLRHAKSSWSDPGMSDFDRPLNQRGRLAAPVMGQRMKAAGIEVDLVLASTAVRVRQTLDLLLPAWNYSGQVVWEKQVYLASLPLLLEQLSALEDNWPRVMLVGHNPGLSELVGYLTDAHIDMPTAALAALETAGTDWRTAVRHRPWHQLSYWTPKDE